MKQILAGPFRYNPSRKAMDDVHNLRHVAEMVISARQEKGDIFPPNIVEMMISEAREAIKRAMLEVLARERAE